DDCGRHLPAQIAGDPLHPSHPLDKVRKRHPTRDEAIAVFSGTPGSGLTRSAVKDRNHLIGPRHRTYLHVGKRVVAARMGSRLTRPELAQNGYVLFEHLATVPVAKANRFELGVPIADPKPCDDAASPT